MKRWLNIYGYEYRGVDCRRKPPDQKVVKGPLILAQKTHEMIRLKLMGLPNTEIARMLGTTESVVSIHLNSELAMQKLGELRKRLDDKTIDVLAEVTKLFPRALRIYQEILEDEADEIPWDLKKKTADTVLMDLGGHRAPTKLQSTTLTLTREDIEELKRRARESGALVDREGTLCQNLTEEEK